MSEDGTNTGRLNEEVLFLEAIEIEDPRRRGEYLDQACQADAALRRRVEELIQAHEQSGAFLKIAGITNSSGNTKEDTAAEPGTKVQTPGELTSVDPTEGKESLDLSILAPSTKPGSLGRLLHYEIEEILGSGGCGTVFRAFDEKLHRRVAVKLMAAELAVTSPARKRFLREARAAAAIRHDNVVQIYAVEEQPLPFIVMEYIAGQTLQEMHEAKGPFPLEEIVTIGQQIAYGLAAAHASGLIHRDIKPGNILVEDGTGRVKITDFGLARAADDASITQSGVIAGTPLFMSPEQARGETLDYRSDLFSLGSVLYVMCSGRPPFRAANTMAVLKRVVEDTPRAIPEIVPEIPEWLIRIVEKLHAKDREDRFQSATEVAARLSLRDRAPLPPEHPATAAPAGDVAPGGTLASKSDATTVFLAGSHTVTRRFSETVRRPWAMAALALLAVILGFGMTEAAGVTAVTKTVIRLFTPTGTLVVEVDDPNISLRIDGEEVVITGAGNKELRLKPGQYEVEAKEGDALILKQLVNISSNGREVLKISQEAGGKLGDSPQLTRDIAASAATPRPPAALDQRLASILKGTWSIDGLELVQSGTSHSLISFGDPNWTDIDFSYETMTTSNAADSQGGVGLYRVLDFNNHLAFALGAYGGKYIELHRIIQGKWSRDDGTTLPFSFEPLRWYRVKLQLRGDKTTCFLDGEKILTMTDAHRLQGKVGFASWNSAVRFRSIRVTDPHGNLLWEDVPDLPQASPAASVPAISETAVRTPVLTMRHEDPVRFVAFTPDGSRVVSASNGDDHEIRGSVRFHVAGKDNTVRVWDARTGTETRRFRMTEGQHYGPLGIAVSADGKSLAASSGWATANGPSEPRVYVWNMETGERLHQFPLVDNHCVRCVTFSPQGGVLKLARSGNGGINSWTLPLGSSLPRVSIGEVPPSVEAPRMSWSPDAKFLLSAVWNGRGDWIAWNAENGEIVKTFKGHTSPPRYVVMSTDGRLVLTCADDYTIRLWDWQTGRQLLCLGDDEILDSVPYSASFSPGGKTFAVGFRSGKVRVYGQKAGTLLEEFAAHFGGVGDLQFSRDGSRLVTAGGDGGVKVWDFAAVPLRSDEREIDPEAAAIRYVLEHGGKVRINNDPVEKRTLKEIDFSSPMQLRGLQLPPRSNPDLRDFEVFRRCEGIESIHLNECVLGEAHLAVFAGIGHLKELSLMQTKVPGKALADFVPNPSLKKLEVWGSPLDAKSLLPFANSPIEHLDLGATRIPAEGFQVLGNLGQLRFLRLSFTPVSAGHVEHLWTAVQLRELEVDHTGCDDTAAPHWKPLVALERLSIYNTKIGDTTLAELAKLPNLRSLDIRGTGVTAAAVDRFRAANPRCKVDWSGGPSVMLPTSPSSGGEVASPDLKAARYVLEHGGAVRFKGDFSKFHEKVEEVDWKKPRPLVEIRLDRLSNVGPEVFAMFALCPTLQSISLQNSDITAEHLQPLESLAFLTTLRLSNNSRIAGRALRSFKNLSHLEGWAVQLKDEDLAALKNNPWRYLDIGGTQVTGKGLRLLTNLGDLRYARLAYINLRNEDIAVFRDCTRLETLALYETKIGDEGVRHLRGLPSLRTLELQKTLVTDGVFEHLSTLPELTFLDVRDTKVSRPAIDRFRESHPLCQVRCRDGDLPREGWGDDIVTHAAIDRNAANFVLDIGRSVWIDDQPDPVWRSSSLLPFHKFKLKGIGLEGLRNLTPEDFHGFRHCRNIEVLNLNDTAVTDEHLKVFEKITTITRLSLNGAKVTEKGLSYFAGCGKMRILSAWAVPVDDTFIRSVANPEFTFLNLGATRITDASMEAFGGFSKLTWATLNLTGLSDKGVACLKDAKQLTYLGLNGSKITDRSAEVFATLESLEELLLSETRFTDLGLDRLAMSVPKLRTLDLKKTQVTKEGIQRFKASHPQCRVGWDGGELKPVD